MAFYITIAVWLSFCALIGKKYRNLIWFNVFLLSLINGLRDVSIGIDTENYYDIWIWISQGKGQFIEPAWYFLNKGIQLIGGGYNLFLWIVALITFIPIGYIAKKYILNPSLALLFYFFITFYLQSFNMMRQDVAISIIAISYVFLLKKKKLKYYITVLLACLFHTSAICSLAVLLIPKKMRLTNAKIINLQIVSLFSSFLLSPGIISLFIGSYAIYLQGGEGVRENIASAYILGILANLFYLFIYNTIRIEHRDTWIMRAYFLGILLMNITTQLELGTRIILYFTILQVFIYPIYLQNNRFKDKYTAPTLVFTYAIIFFLKFLIGDPLRICPYQFFF